MRAGEGWSGEFTVRRRDGTTFPAFVTDTPVFDERGSLRAIVGVSMDITGRKLAEERLRRSEQQLADFFENATVGLHWVGPDGTILRTNRAELHLLGYERMALAPDLTRSCETLFELLARLL
jgi:PAS domain-containing protein